MSASDPAQTEPWTVGRLLNWTRDFFQRKGLEEPRLAAEILLAHAMGCKRIELYTRFEQVPPPEQVAVFRDAVKRAGDHAPIAHLVGHKEFFSLEFEVNEHVLVPRPETELLVEQAVDWMRRRFSGRPAIQEESQLGSAEEAARAADLAQELAARQLSQAEKQAADGSEPAAESIVATEAASRRDAANTANTANSANAAIAASPSVLDFGTGTGCIAVAIAKYVPKAEIWASDVSAAALEVASRNVARHGVESRVRLIEADGLPSTGTGAPDRFDVICSNPPYIAETEMPSLPENVRRYEPRLALTDEGDGYRFYRLLAKEGANRLVPGGAVFVEIAEGQAEQVVQIFTEAQGSAHEAVRFRHAATWRDKQVGHDRVIQFEFVS